jgi:hypothetical protein
MEHGVIGEHPGCFKPLPSHNYWKTDNAGKLEIVLDI